MCYWGCLVFVEYHPRDVNEGVLLTLVLLFYSLYPFVVVITYMYMTFLNIEWF